MGGEDLPEEPVLAAVKPLNSVKTSADYPDPVPAGGGATRWSEAVTGRIAGARESDSQRLAALFETHHCRIFRTAYRVTGSAEDAEDVLQTVFLRVARGQETAENAENIEAYFSRAAVNASLDLIRSRKRSRAVAIEDVENSTGLTNFVSRQNPETHQQDRELRELIREAVAKLGGTAAQMFTLRYFEGHSNGDIARIMNTSPLVVGVTLHRARTRLRKEIGKYLRAGHA